MSDRLNDLLDEDIVWRHFKGKFYKVLMVAVDCNEAAGIDSLQVIYEQCGRPEMVFARSVDEWFELVGEQQRFEKVTGVTP